MERNHLKLIEDKINVLQERIKPKEVKSVLKDPVTKQYLEQLHNAFVMVPIDKASNNISLICKKFYVLTLIKEVGLLNSNNPTYERVTKNKVEIIEIHAKTLSEKYRLKVNSENEDLPCIYWLPKMHKYPIGHRFIIASKKCSMKPLSKNISSIFKVFYNLIESYHNKSKFFSGLIHSGLFRIINLYWRH